MLKKYTVAIEATLWGPPSLAEEDIDAIIREETKFSEVDFNVREIIGIEDDDYEE